MINQKPLKCIILWGLLILCMILHFNYHIGGLFYGIAIEQSGANGTIPNSTHIIRFVFYILPMLWILLLLFTHKKWIKILLSVVASLYFLSHLLHFYKELSHPDYSQIPLLGLTVIICGILTYNHFTLINYTNRYYE